MSLYPRSAPESDAFVFANAGINFETGSFRLTLMRRIGSQIGADEAQRVGALGRFDSATDFFARYRHQRRGLRNTADQLIAEEIGSLPHQ